jgi:ribonuclease HI
MGGGDVYRGLWNRSHLGGPGVATRGLLQAIRGHRTECSRHLRHGQRGGRDESGRYPPDKARLEPKGTNSWRRPSPHQREPRRDSSSLLRRQTIRAGTASRWVSEASGGSKNRLIKEGRTVEISTPRARLRTPWTQPRTGRKSCHAWTDGSFQEAAGSGWIITGDDKGGSPTVAEGLRNIGSQQTTFDAELAAIEQAVPWFLGSGQGWQHMTIHSDSTSAIARAGHTGVGPGQKVACNIRRIVCELRSRTIDLVWVKGHEGTPGNEKADVLAAKAAEKPGHSKVMPMAHLKLEISERFRSVKEAWHKADKHHGKEEIPPPPKKSCLDNMRDALARTLAQIQTSH